MVQSSPHGLNYSLLANMSSRRNTREGGGLVPQKISAMSCFEFITKYKNLALDKSVRQCSHCDSYAADYPTWSRKKIFLRVTKILPRPYFCLWLKIVNTV